MNRTIKETLTKLTLETGTRDWVRLLLLALYRARNTPGPHGLTPFEIIYGSPPPAISFFDSDISALMTSPTLHAHLQALQLVQQEIWKPISATYRADNPVPCPHLFKIGDTVLVRRHQTKTLEPRWKGPYTVLLMPTALKVDGIAAWIHASHVKAAPGRDHKETSEPRWKLHRTQNPLKLTFSLVTLLLCLPLVEGNASPHQLVNLTWLVLNPETRSPLNSSSNIAPKGI